MNSISTSALMSALVFFGASAFADDSDWQVRTNLQGLYGPYGSTEERDQLSSIGLFLHADYLDRGGLILGYNHTMVGFNDSSADIDQDQLYLSGRFSLIPDWAGGQIGLRFDVHGVDNNDEANGTGDLNILAPQISYLNNAKTIYFDLGYARSEYGDADALTGDLDVEQFTPTFGFGVNEGRDWVQIRAYLIDVSNPGRAQGTSDTSAVEATWKHWFTGRGLLGLDNIKLLGLAGERIYAVDPDSAAVYNVADVQKGSVAVAGQWRLNDSNQLLLQLGYEKYTNERIADDYSSPYVYIGYTHDWN